MLGGEGVKGEVVQGPFLIFFGPFLKVFLVPSRRKPYIK